MITLLLWRDQNSKTSTKLVHKESKISWKKNHTVWTVLVCPCKKWTFRSNSLLGWVGWHVFLFEVYSKTNLNTFSLLRMLLPDWMFVTPWTVGQGHQRQMWKTKIAKYLPTNKLLILHLLPLFLFQYGPKLGQGHGGGWSSVIASYPSLAISSLEGGAARISVCFPGEALSQFLFGAIGNCHLKKTLGILSLGLFSSSTPLHCARRPKHLHYIGLQALSFHIPFLILKGRDRWYIYYKIKWNRVDFILNHIYEFVRWTS